MGDVSGAQFRVSNGADILVIEESDGSVTFTAAAGPGWTFNSTSGGLRGFKIESGAGNQAGSLGYNVGTGRFTLLAGDGGASTIALALEGTPTVYSASIAADTVGDAANMVINSSTGRIQRSTSSARYKTNIEPLKDWRFLLDIEPVTFESKDTGKHYIGLTAENVAVVEPRLAVFDGQGRPDEVAYGHLTAPIIKAIQELCGRLESAYQSIDELKNRVKQLEQAEIS
jgi:hypothetical protein